MEIKHGYMLIALQTVFIKGILESAGTEVNPVALIKRIKDGLEIPGLRDSLVKVLQDFNLQVSCFPSKAVLVTKLIHCVQITLLEGCQDILQSDCRRLSDRFMGQQKKAFLGGRRCCICEDYVAVQLTLLFSQNFLRWMWQARLQ